MNLKRHIRVDVEDETTDLKARKRRDKVGVGDNPVKKAMDLLCFYTFITYFSKLNCYCCLMKT